MELVQSLPAAVRHTPGEVYAIQMDKISMISRLRVELPLANQLLSEAHSLNELFQELQPHAKSLQILSQLCRSELTVILPCSIAKIESCFSPLTRLLCSIGPQRVSIKHERTAQASTSFACFQQGHFEEHRFDSICDSVCDVQASTLVTFVGQTTFSGSGPPNSQLKCLSN